jgi:imidazolonepropionase
MTNRMLVRGARQLLTLHGPPGPRRGNALRELGLIEDGAVLIENGTITSVGSTRRIENLAQARGATEVDATGRVVMPGFVDSHTHLVCGPPRLTDYEMRIAGASYAEIAAKGGGIPLTMKYVRLATAKRLVSDAMRVLQNALHYGTTTMEAKSGYGLDEAGEIKTLRVIEACASEHPVDLVATYLGAHIVPVEFQGRAEEYVNWMCAQMMPQIRRRNLARFVDVYCEPGAFDTEQARRYLSVAQQLGFGIKLHAEQFEGTGGAKLGVEMNAASVDHLEQAGQAEAELLSRSNTVATLLPGSVYHLGLTRYAPARLLIERGCAVALASDFNMGTSPTYSMPMVLSLACTQMRMTPAEAICAATINGAHALGMAHTAGSLEFGKQADLLILEVSDYREVPYFFGVNPVRRVIKKGQMLFGEKQ